VDNTGGWYYKLKKNISPFVVGFTGIFLLYTGFLFYLQIITGNRCQAKIEQQLDRYPVQLGLRGDIYSSDGVLLARSLDRLCIFAYPSRMRNPKKTARDYAAFLGMDPKLLTKKFLSTGSRICLIPQADKKMEEKFRIHEAKLSANGLEISKPSGGIRIYPQKTLACHLLGYAGSDDQGLAGVEVAQDKLLRGSYGNIRKQVDGWGGLLPGSIMFPPSQSRGYNLVLTIDSYIQYIAEEELQKAVRSWHARSGCVIVMKAKTGEILALATYPPFNPQAVAAKIAGGVSDKEYRDLTFRYRNRAIQDNYEPGSTFKVIVAGAALDAGLVSVNDRFYSANGMPVGAAVIHNAADGFCSGSGMETVADILVYSYNVGMASLGLACWKKNPNKFYRHLKAFGLNQKTGIDLWGESPGDFPGERDWDRRPFKELMPVEIATVAFGQGVAITPIQLVSAYQAIANDGVRLKPQIIKQVINERGEVEKEARPEVLGRAVSVKTARKMRSILREIVDRGTGTHAQIPGYEVGGKTGTAQIPVPGGYDPDHHIPSFAGIVPAGDPELVVLVKVDAPEGPGWGGVVSAPVFKEVTQQALQHLKIPPKTVRKEKPDEN